MWHTLVITYSIKNRTVKFWPSLARFIRLLDGHVTQACIALIVAFGGWAPLVLNGEAARSVAAHQLPDTVSLIQQIAMVGILVSIFVSLNFCLRAQKDIKRAGMY